MCGRYATSRGAVALAEAYDAADETGGEVTTSWNVAPTMLVPVVLERPDVGRVLRSVKWGLVPSWSKDAKGGARFINARSETVATNGTFRKAFEKRRCLVPVDGWYEWRKPERTPFYVTAADGLTLAGLYEMWRDPTKEQDDPTRWLFSCTILTAEAPGPLAWLHDRTPVVLARDDQAAWLDPTADVTGLLHGPSADEVTVREVSKRVNAVRNDGPENLDPPDDDGKRATEAVQDPLI